MDIHQGIQATSDHERILFGAVREPFGSNLDRWHCSARPENYNSNFFMPLDALTRRDVQSAVAFQKQQGISEVMFSTTQPVDPDVFAGYTCDEYAAHVMALLSDQSHLWQTNAAVEIRDIQTHDVSAEMLDVSRASASHRDAVRRDMQLALTIAKAHPEYHWYCACMDGKHVGGAYAVEHNGFVVMDDLWVTEEYQHRKIATTILKHIVDHTDGIVCLHAATTATPKDMYARMGFEIVETVHEYYLEW